MSILEASQDIGSPVLDQGMDQSIDTSRVFTYKHLSGEVVSATVLDMDRCVVMGKVALEDRIAVAELHAMSQNLNEEKEEETKETEAEEETAEKEGRIKVKEEAKESGKNTNDAQQEKDPASRQEARKAEPSQAAESQKQEVMTTSETVAKPEAALSTETTGNSAAQLSAVEIIVPEKVAQIISPESQPAKNLAKVETPATSGASDYSKESPVTERVSAVVAESPAAPQLAAKTDIYPRIENEVPQPGEVIIPAVTKTEGLSIKFDEAPQIDELYQTPDPEIEVSYAGVEAESVMDDSKITLQLPMDEQWYPPAEFVEQELTEGQTNEDFILPITETLAFDMVEYVRDGPEAEIEVSVPVEEVEQSILLVADNIEKMEDGEAETAYQILDEIAHKIAEAQKLVKKDSENAEVIMETTDLEEELKELFIQLIDQVEIEYSPELVESCVKLALQGDMSELIAKIEQEDEETDVSHDSGTHEVMKQILATIIHIKKSVVHAYQIGKSTLRLYFQQLPTT